MTYFKIHYNSVNLASNIHNIVDIVDFFCVLFAKLLDTFDNLNNIEIQVVKNMLVL